MPAGAEGKWGGQTQEPGTEPSGQVCAASRPWCPQWVQSELVSPVHDGPIFSTGTPHVRARPVLALSQIPARIPPTNPSSISPLPTLSMLWRQRLAWVPSNLTLSLEWSTEEKPLSKGTCAYTQIHTETHTDTWTHRDTQTYINNTDTHRYT